MARRPTVPLLVAIACAAGLIVVALLALGVPSIHERDAAMLHGFMGLDRPRVHEAIVVLAHLADPAPYALAGLAMVGVALVRGLRWRAGAVVVLLAMTGASTQIVKHLLAQPRFEEWLGAEQVGEAAWPSGHSTAAMTLALCAVLVAPPALRFAVAVAGGAFAAGVGYAVVVLAWHFPSDVLGGFLMAGIWTALAVAGLRLVERRETGAEPAAESPLGIGLGLAAAGAVVAGVVAVVVPHGEVTLYAAERPTFVAGALVIAALAGALSAGLARAA